jgi:riboflavin synthase
MFTGIVEELGSVAVVNGRRVTIACRTVREGSPVGASVAVNGICLTVVERPSDGLAFDLSEETLARTALSGMRPGDRVNLERAVTLASRLSGHLVQGHVDGVGTVERLDGAEGGVMLAVRVPDELRRYLVDKGSVAVDGVSLTVAALDGDTFSVALVPHTLAVTTLGSVRPGDRVNLEIDVIAKYVEGLLRADREGATDG